MGDNGLLVLIVIGDNGVLIVIRMKRTGLVIEENGLLITIADNGLVI